MNFIRGSLLGGGQDREGSDLERQTPADVAGQTQNDRRLLASITRSAIPSLFAGRFGQDGRGRSADESGSEGDDGPKPPAAASDRVRPSSLVEPRRIPGARTQRFPVLARPLAARTNGEEPGRERELELERREPERRVRRSWLNGSDPAALRLANVATRGGRERQHARNSPAHSGSSQSRRRKEPPKRFLFCFPWVQSRRARSLILRCFVSGIFLVSMLTVYLSLSITKNINTSEFSILLIILILLTTIFFCHGLIRLCMILVRPRKRSGAATNDGAEFSKYGHPGYAIPVQPIRVVLARDEEAAGIESETARTKPPAYGLWRESVRVDPNRIYWQRAGSPPLSSLSSASSTTDDSSEEGGPRAGQRRPPSYASDDGIEYVVDARPRSIAPPPSSIYSQPSTISAPLPPPPPPVVMGPGRRAMI